MSDESVFRCTSATDFVTGLPEGPRRDDDVWRTGENRRTEPLPAPDPYAYALRGMRAAQAPSPEDDRDYQPFGTPPDGYQIAIARMRKDGRR